MVCNTKLGVSKVYNSRIISKEYVRYIYIICIKMCLIERNNEP